MERRFSCMSLPQLQPSRCQDHVSLNLAEPDPRYVNSTRYVTYDTPVK
jgi:hypothetical protein